LEDQNHPSNEEQSYSDTEDVGMSQIHSAMPSQDVTQNDRLEEKDDEFCKLACPLCDRMIENNQIASQCKDCLIMIHEICDQDQIHTTDNYKCPMCRIEESQASQNISGDWGDSQMFKEQDVQDNTDESNHMLQALHTNRALIIQRKPIQPSQNNQNVTKAHKLVAQPNKNKVALVEVRKPNLTLQINPTNATMHKSEVQSSGNNHNHAFSAVPIKGKSSHTTMVRSEVLQSQRVCKIVTVQTSSHPMQSSALLQEPSCPQ
jgi:hypothetical protein